MWGHYPGTSAQSHCTRVKARGARVPAEGRWYRWHLQDAMALQGVMSRLKWHQRLPRLASPVQLAVSAATQPSTVHEWT